MQRKLGVAQIVEQNARTWTTVVAVQAVSSIIFPHFIRLSNVIFVDTVLAIFWTCVLIGRRKLRP
jgi:hypothetical protein